ncbi:MAG TPA: alpha/beta fold hydrolase [Candidatus Thermoplasmatota archaeon]|nr:alpha/beta fold hydrolase [Candidatus Thermoplasmatota archaeon]
MRSVLAVLVALALLPLAGCLGGDGKEATAPPVPCDPCEDECDGGSALCSTPDADPLPPAVPAWPHFPSDGAVQYSTLEIPSFDEHQIPVSVYKPKVASADQKVPVLLHSHGFTGKRATAEDAFTTLVAAGFGVVSFDERGHGDSKDDSAVYFMHPEYEVKDVQKVIDHVATFDWVLMESAGDPLLGAIGGSYGGAYQLMGAIFDPRLDAIVPEITWNDITEALAPGGAIKSGWVDLFYLAGNAQQSVVFSDDFHAGFAYATASNNFPAGQLPGVPDLYTRLKEASPVSYPGRITIPTLLIQGMPDTLFPLNQAVANLRMLEEAGLPADQTALYTHLGGHVLSVNSLRADTSPYPVGLQGQPGGKPCGQLVDLQVAWHQKHLLGLPVDTGPRVCISLEDETNVVGPTFPLPGTEMRPFDLPGPTPVVQGPAGPQVPMSLFTADEDVVVAGIPVLNGTITAPGADTIVYFSLKIVSRVDPFESIVDDQVVPLRIAGPNAGPIDFSIALGGVATRVKAGEELLLVASTVEPIYFGNAERVPGGTVLQDLRLELPIVPPDTPSLAVPAPT